MAVRRTKYKKVKRRLRQANSERLGNVANRRDVTASPQHPPGELADGDERPATPPLTPTAPLAPLYTSTPSTRQNDDDLEHQRTSPIRPMTTLLNGECPAPQVLTGRRLVRIKEVLDQIQQDWHPGGTGCSFMNSAFVKETRKGFQSKLLFKCTVCQKLTAIDTDKRDPDTLSVNRAVVTGALAGGGGFANIDEVSAAADMPCMSQSTYIHHERKVGLLVEDTMLQNMLDNGREERRLALEAGDSAPDGTPRIRVIADGMWSKRSYGSKYDALSGFACIIGSRTRKVLFYGVRKKHCYVCTIAASKGVNVKAHECCKNFNGSSTQMETAIVLEGFKVSEEMHGLRYHQLVADRDSSVYNAIVTHAPYGPLEVVQKINCKNHLCRNYRSWVLELAGNTRLPLPPHVDGNDPKAVRAMRKEMLALRSVFKDRVIRLSSAIDKASTQRGSEPGPLRARIDLLQQDIRNVAAHVFGEHTACATYFCRTAQARGAALEAATAPSTCSAPSPVPVTTTPEDNLVPRLQAAGIWKELVKQLAAIADHADSLIHNMTNNQCEVTNSVVAKFLAGKRLCYSRRTSFNTRCSTAALAMNTSGQFRHIMHRALQNGVSPGRYTAVHSKWKMSRLLSQRRRRALLKVTKHRAPRRLANGPDKDYGLSGRVPQDVDDPDEVTQGLPPLPEDPKLQDRVQGILENLRTAEKTREKIWEYQQGSTEWLQERRIRLTASNFGLVCRRNRFNSCKNLVHQLLYQDSRAKSGPMQHGRDTERWARRHYEEKHGVHVQTRGLVVDKALNFLAASTDGLIGEDSLIEIKCPTSSVDYPSAIDAVRANKLENVQLTEDGDLELRRSKHHYYQIQGQLHITDREFCIYYIFQTKKAAVKGGNDSLLWDAEILVKRDEEFWRNSMEPHLVEFYNQALLPEIASSRFTCRGKVDDIREAEFTHRARQEKDRMAKDKEERCAERRRQTLMNRERAAEERESKKRQREDRDRKTDGRKKKAEGA